MAVVEAWAGPLPEALTESDERSTDCVVDATSDAVDEVAAEDSAAKEVVAAALVVLTAVA